MASLKEIKSRIGSVQGTRKVTSAMKMVSSAKLHKAQGLIQNLLPYQRQLDRIVGHFLSSSSFSSPFIASPADDRDSKPSRAAVVAFSSNSSLCGAYNNNIIKRLGEVVASLSAEGMEKESITVYPVGKKVEEHAKRAGMNVVSAITGRDGSPFTLQSMAAAPDYGKIKDLAGLLINEFAKGTSSGHDGEGVQRVIVIYHHFKSPGVQTVEQSDYLPLDVEACRGEAESRGRDGYFDNYIVEPSVGEVLETLIPQVLIQKLYTCCVDAYASEHAARTIAMQVATDNADDLISELSILYNKTRQQAITAELLDIVAGTGK